MLPFIDGSVGPIGLGFLAGIIVTISIAFLRFRKQLFAEKRAEELLTRIRTEAEDERRSIISRTRDEVNRKRSELELELKKKRIDLQRDELRLNKGLDDLVRREREFVGAKDLLDQKEREIIRRIDRLNSEESKVKKAFDQLVRRLEEVSGMSQLEAKKVLFDALREEVKLENQSWINKMAEEAKERAKDRTITILMTAMQKYTGDQVSIHSASTVQLPNEEMKGRIIGKEGRNIKALEMATGMEFVIGDTPEIITISGFNPIRREVAKKALLMLIQDGRINPTRIEEIVARCESEVEEEISKLGQDTALEFGFASMDRNIADLLGRLHYRTSYTQNVLDHSKEVAHFARIIANELGLDGKLAARCGLLHDLGKAVTCEQDGPHALLGADLAKKHGESEIVVNAIAAHHEDVPPSSPYAVITMIADAISASRIGARKETLAAYVKRIEQLEDICNSMDGVKKAYALQAGREIRVIVDESNVDDDRASVLARDIARKIEEQMSFPGQIKVNVIREKRAVEYAK